MRKNRLLTATALSMTLAVFCLADPALADTSIATATTVPVKTSTGGNVTVTTAGSITLTSGTAITVDSDNSVALVGKVDMSKSAGGSTAILIDGAHTANITLGSVDANGATLGGAISVTDDYTATDTKNTDTIVDGPFAHDTGRYGIHSTGATPLIGSVDIKSGSTIGIEGNQSYGIRLENKLQGTFTQDGAIGILGDQNVGVALDNGATGRVYLSGSITTLGSGSSAVTLKGDFGDAIVIDGTFSGTGYATDPTSIATADALAKILATPEDMGQTGVLVDISGNVAKGILLGSSVVVDTTKPTNLDQDGDGTKDATQTTAGLSVKGSAPALRIASATNDITVGGLVYAGTALNPPAINYALAIRGGVSASGLYQGINATGVQLGGLAHSVTLEKGVQVKGTVQATTYGGVATALLVGNKAQTPRLDIDGVIKVSTTQATTGTGTTTVVTPGSAIALDIAAGATLPIVKIGAGAGIAAAATGSTTPITIAIRDRSDTLTSIINNGAINSVVTPTDDNGDNIAEAVVNHGIAIDTRGNTHDLTLTQVDTAPADTTADNAIAAPYILGEVLLGNGNDTVSSSGGQIAGNMDFGGGAANSFTLTGKATYAGRMTGTGAVALNIADGSAVLLDGSHLNVTTLQVGATSLLALTLDTDHPTIPVLVGSGAATFASGATLNLTPNHLITNPSDFTILTASSIDLGTLSTTTLDGHIPYMYHADLTKNGANTELYAHLRLKSQAEAQYSDNQYAALAPVLNVIATDATARSELMSQLTREGFDRIYNQYLPDYSGENILDLSLGATSLNRSLGTLSLVPKKGGQYWLQEYGYHTTRNYGDTAGFKSTGFSFAGGRETEILNNQTVGVYLSYTSATPADTFAIAQEELVNSDVTLGGYWRMKLGAFKSWAHAGIGHTDFKSTRQSADLAHTAKGDWTGYSWSAGGGASVDYKLGQVGVSPTVLADYYALKENAHTETGGGSTFDLTVADRDSHLFSSTAMLNFTYGHAFIKPELWIGYKQNISAQIADTVSRFGATGTPFTLNGGDLEGGGPIAGFRISTDNEWSYFGVEGDYEKQDNYTNYSISLRTRFQF